MSRLRPISEGWAIIAPLVLLAYAARRRPLLGTTALAAAAGVAAFLRDPERTPLATDAALSPADGVVVAIETVRDEHLERDMLQIAIFLSLFDVHVQRAPIAGRITHVELTAGGYRKANIPAAAENFRQTLYFDTDWGPIAVSQIAGLLARRIVRWVGPGDELAAGDRIGIIKFGSRVTLRLPLGTQILVQVGDKVRAGLTAVAARP